MSLAQPPGKLLKSKYTENQEVEPGGDKARKQIHNERYGYGELGINLLGFFFTIVILREGEELLLLLFFLAFLELLALAARHDGS